MFNYTLFSQRLSSERIRHGHTMKSLSQLTGIPKTTLQGYESQSVIVDIENLIKIADALDVSLDWITGRK